MQMSTKRRRKPLFKPPCYICGKPSVCTVYSPGRSTIRSTIRVCADCAVTVGVGAFEYGDDILMSCKNEAVACCHSRVI